MFTLFYESGIGWFDTVANGMVWLCISAFAACMIWLGYDLVTGPRKQREEVKRMLEGINNAKRTNYGHELISLSGASRPFGRKEKTKKTPAHAELDS